MAQWFVLVRFVRRSGKMDTVMEALSSAMLRVWGLKNTTSSKDTIIFRKDTGQVVCYMTGNGSFPDVCDDADALGNIEDYCPGLLEEVNKVSRPIES